MTARLVILIFAFVAFGTGFYLTTYQDNMAQQKPLNMKLLAELEEAHKASLEGVHATAEAAVSSKEVIIDLNNPVIKSGHDIYHEKGQCITCHGDMGQGNKEKEAPLLAGQYEWYILGQLNAFKSGERNNAVMSPYIKDLSEEDFKNVAEYIKLLRVK